MGIPFVPDVIQGINLVSYLGHGENWAISVQDDRAYLGANLEMSIIDVSRSSQPERLGHIVLPGPVTGIAVTGAHAYVTTGFGSGLFVIDISNPASPIVISTHYAGSHLAGVVFSGDLAIVTGIKLHMMDISDPAEPVEVSYYEFPLGYTGGKKTAVSGGYAYALYQGSAGRTGGFQIINISDPTRPSITGDFTAPFNIHEIIPIGDYVYLLVGTGLESADLVVVDISDPEHPVEVSLDSNTAWRAVSMAVSGRFIFLADPGGPGTSGSLKIFDVADPVHPKLTGYFDGVNQPAGAMTVDNRLAYVTSDDGLAIVDISEPTAPSRAGLYMLDRLPDLGRDIVVSGSYAYIADGWSGLLVVDISRPNNPLIVSSLDTAGIAWGLALDGNLVYVADEYNGLRVIDISNPINPVEVGFYDLPGQFEFFHNVTIADKYAYVADGGYEAGEIGLRVLNVSNPAKPTAEGYLTLKMPEQERPFARIEDVVVAGDYAYVAAGTAGLRVIDVTEPAAPVEVGSYETPGRADNLAVSGRFAFLVDGDLRIIDLFDPAAPALVGFFDIQGFSATPYVAVQGHYAYVTGNGIQVLDSSNHKMLVEAAGYPLASGSVTVAGEMVYVVGEGFFILRTR